MKKTKELIQGLPGLNTMNASLLLLAGAVSTLLGGCETVSPRTSLMAPPPPFYPAATGGADLSAMDPSYSVSSSETLDEIEPAAGAAMPLPEAAVVTSSVSDRSSCNLRLGVKGGDALYYQWGGNRLGLNFVSAQRNDSELARATLRYTISLQKNSPAPSADSCLDD